MTHGDGFKQEFLLNSSLSRTIVSKSDSNDVMVKIEWSGKEKLELWEVLDRAHFPVNHFIEKKV